MRRLKVLSIILSVTYLNSYYVKFAMIFNPTVLLPTKYNIETLVALQIMLELESKDINSTLPVLTETDNETYVFNEKEEVVYNWNVIDINTLIILRTCDNETSTRFYNI